MAGRWLRRFLPIVAALALVAVACGDSGSGAQEYKTDEALFKVPVDWHLYEPDELVALPSVPFVNPDEENYPVVSQVAFDGAPGRAVTNLDVSLVTAPHPVGAFTVRNVSQLGRETLSRDELTSNVLDADELRTVNIDLFQDFEFSSDYEGIRRVITFTDGEGQDAGVVYFISVTDAVDSKIFSMAAGCSFDCWTTNQQEIVEVVDSWLVNTNR